MEIHMSSVSDPTPFGPAANSWIVSMPRKLFQLFLLYIAIAAHVTQFLVVNKWWEAKADRIVRGRAEVLLQLQRVTPTAEPEPEYWPIRVFYRLIGRNNRTSSLVSSMLYYASVIRAQASSAYRIIWNERFFLLGKFYLWPMLDI